MNHDDIHSKAAEACTHREPTFPIAESLFVPIGGIDQRLTIRGVDPGNPVLLIVSGAGAALRPWARFFAPWEARFTLVHWDQPGAGETLERNGTLGGPLSIERLVGDAISVTDFLCAHLSKRRIALLAISGGTIVGLSVARRRPDLLSAYVGCGQIVNWAVQDASSYALLLEQARASGDAAASAELATIGPPPYPDTATDAVKSKYAGAPTAAEREALAALSPEDLAVLHSGSFEEARARATAAYDALRPEIVSFDARKLGLAFDVPMFFLQGELDFFTVTSEVRAYAASLIAPQTRFVPIAGGGHSAYLMRDEFLRLLDAHVRPAAIAGERRATRSYAER